MQNKTNLNVSRETILYMNNLITLLPYRERIFVEEIDKEGYYKLLYSGEVCDYIENDFENDKRKVNQIFTFNNELVIVLESEVCNAI